MTDIPINKNSQYLVHYFLGHIQYSDACHDIFYLYVPKTILDDLISMERLEPPYLTLCGVVYQISNDIFNHLTLTEPMILITEKIHRKIIHK